MPLPPTNAHQKEPRQLGGDLVQTLADVLAHHQEFLDDVHDAKPLFFRGTVTAFRTVSGTRQVQVKRTGRTTADTTWYPVFEAGYVSPLVGDDVLLVYTDRRMSACVIGTRNGVVRSSVTTITTDFATYTIDQAPIFVVVEAHDVSVNFPHAAANSGLPIVVKNAYSTAVYNTLLVPQSGETIEGFAPMYMSVAGFARRLMSDGTTWRSVGGESNDCVA